MIQNIDIGFYHESSYNTMFYIGCIFFIVLLCWKKHREVYGITLWKAAVMSVISIFFGYFTTSLMFGIENYDLSNLSGFSWYGAVFFMPIAMLIIFWFLKYILKICTLNYIHNLAAPLALMNGFMKIGCTLYGCCYGYPSSFGFYNIVLGQKAFPIQLVEALWNFAVCGFILWFEHKPGKIKYVYPTYMVVYSVGRFFCEFGRKSSLPLAGTSFYTGGMLYATLAIIIGVIWILAVKSIEDKEVYRISHTGGVSGWRQRI